MALRLVILGFLVVGAFGAGLWLRGWGGAPVPQGVTAQAGDTRVTLHVERDGTGPWQIDVWLRDDAGDPVDARALSLRFSMPYICTQEVVVAPARVAPGHFQAQAQSFVMSGAWQTLVSLEPQGSAPAQATLFVPITVAEEQAITAPTGTPAPAALSAGRLLYTTRCASCHGPAGAGDGPAATGLASPPPDLRQHTAAGKHTDAQLFLFVSRGVPGSAMPGFADTLTPDEIWQLVAFLRTLPE